MNTCLPADDKYESPLKESWIEGLQKHHQASDGRIDLPAMKKYRSWRQCTGGLSEIPGSAFVCFIIGRMTGQLAIDVLSKRVLAWRHL